MVVYVIAGFLGVGKTTCVLHIARHLIQENKRVVVLENEIGEVPIDAMSLQDQELSVFTLYGGCICCTLKKDLAHSVKMLRAQYNPDVLLIEPSGVAGPDMVVKELQGVLLKEDTIMSVVILNASKMNTSSMISPFIERSIEVASLILINTWANVSQEGIQAILSFCNQKGQKAVICDVRNYDQITHIFTHHIVHAQPMNNYCATASFHEIPSTAHLSCYPFDNCTSISSMEEQVTELLHAVAKTVFTVYTNAQGHIKAHLMPSGITFSTTSSDGVVNKRRRITTYDTQGTTQGEKLSIQMIVYGVSSTDLQTILAHSMNRMCVQAKRA